MLDQCNVKQHSWVKRVSGTWKVTLFEDTRSGELCVGYEGTNSLRNAAGDVLHHIADPTGLFKDMGAVVDKWVKKLTGGRNIWSFVGHSEGGFFANHVKKSWDVFRVSFNGHKAERGLKNMNLRLPGDTVSGTLSVKDRYTTLLTDDCACGHDLKGFKCVQDMGWLDIYPHQLQTTPEPQLQPCAAARPVPASCSAPAPTSDPCPAPSPPSAPNQSRTSEDDAKNAKLAAAAIAVLIPAGAYVGYRVVSATCEAHGLEREDKKTTKTYAAAGGVVGAIGTTAIIVGSGTTTGVSVASVAAGAAALGGGSVVLGLCAAFALPAGAAIGAGWIGHKVYQRYNRRN